LVLGAATQQQLRSILQLSVAVLLNLTENCGALKDSDPVSVDYKDRFNLFEFWTQ